MPSYTQDQLEKLEAAIALGATRVKYADKEVEYRSIDDMIKIREMMRRDLGVVDTSLKGGRHYFSHSKGFTADDSDD